MLAMAVRIGADINVMVWVDGGYGLIEWKQQTQFGRHIDLALGNPVFSDLARAFGWHYVKAETSSGHHWMRRWRTGDRV